MSEIVTSNPATEEVLERFDYHDPVQTEQTVQAARRAFNAWRFTPVPERAQAIAALGRLLRERRDDLVALAVREMGKPIAQARAEVEKCAWCCEHFATHAAEYSADLTVVEGPPRAAVTFRPLGVILAIMPWNFPYWQVVRAAVPALTAGNAVLLKHADNVTRCALTIEELARDAGFPEGLFGVLLLPHDRTDALIADPRIAGVTLTGSDRAGAAVAAAASAALKKTVLELGGSDAYIVLADADLDEAVRTAVTARFQNNGQSCIAAKRFIVEETVHDAFVERFVHAASALRVGDPASEETELGPLARADLRATLHDQVRASIAAGARPVLGGHPLETRGWYYAPTVLTNVVPGMRVFDEETFGPVAAVVRARDTDHAVTLANASPYGLGAAVWTRDVELGQRIAERLACGTVAINGMVASDPRLPFGGVKRSGYGRELSVFGMREFVNVQVVWSP